MLSFGRYEDNEKFLVCPAEMEVDCAMVSDFLTHLPSISVLSAFALNIAFALVPMFEKFKSAFWPISAFNSSFVSFNS